MKQILLLALFQSSSALDNATREYLIKKEDHQSDCEYEEVNKFCLQKCVQAVRLRLFFPYCEKYYSYLKNVKPLEGKYDEEYFDVNDHNNGFLDFLHADHIAEVENNLDGKKGHALQDLHFLNLFGKDSIGEQHDTHKRTYTDAYGKIQYQESEQDNGSNQHHQTSNKSHSQDDSQHQNVRDLFQYDIQPFLYQQGVLTNVETNHEYQPNIEKDLNEFEKFLHENRTVNIEDDSKFEFNHGSLKGKLPLKNAHIVNTQNKYKTKGHDSYKENVNSQEDIYLRALRRDRGYDLYSEDSDKEDYLEEINHGKNQDSLHQYLNRN